MSTLGQQIRIRRLAVGMSQLDLAVAADATQTLISAYETDRRQPMPRTLTKITDALNCDVRLVPKGGAK